MKRSRALASFALLLGMSTVACSVLEDEVGTQEAEHRENDPTYAQYAWLWADESEEEFKRVAGGDYEFSQPDFLPSDHPMTQRLQFWVDAMDEVLRKRSPDAMRAVPKPRVILRKDDDPNAWVSRMPVVWNVPAALAGDPPSPPAQNEGDAGADPTDAAAPDDAGATDAGPAPTYEPPESSAPLLLAANGSVSTLQGSASLERPHDATSIEQLVRYVNGGFSKCRLGYQHDTIVIGKDCSADENLWSRKSKTFAYPATSKWVTVTTGLLTSVLDEDRVVAVLAHELGHYYRTHVFMPTDVVNYFYDLERTSTNDKPPPDPRFLEQTLQAREKFRKAWGWFGPNFDAENAFMKEQRVGFYTTEQEADEISLEILTHLGVPPTTGPDSQLALQKIVEEMSRGGWGGVKDSGELKWEQCSMLRDRGWKDDEGKLVSVPVGDLMDTHHSFCFRVFNMVRELETHKYRPAAERVRPPGDPWFLLLQQVMNDVRPPPPPAVDAGPAPDAGPVETFDAGAGDAGTSSDGGL